LIRVAVTRDITQAVPIAGSFVGAPDSYLGMTVDVSVVPENRSDIGAACGSSSAAQCMSPASAALPI
jgi:hypothetical protein